MRLTFLGPPGYVEQQPDSIDRAAWQKEFAMRSRPTEQSFKARWTQVCMGVGFQYVFLRVGMTVVGFSHYDAMMTMDFGLLPIYLAVLVLGVYVLSALIAGAIAGAWCVNWVFQGIAVGLGWAATLFIQVLLCMPLDMVMNLQIPPTLIVPLLAAAAINTVLAIGGALIGRLLIQPLRLSTETEGAGCH